MSLPEGKYVEVEGQRVHYHEAGEGDRTLVFFHGSGPGASGYSNFKGNFPFFAERGFRVLVPDTVGYGHSSKPSDAKYTLQWMTDHARGFLDAVGADTFSVVGNSMGGAMAIRLALDLPDRVEKLVLMAPGGLEDRETYMAMEGIRRMIRAIFKAGINAETMRGIFELQLHDSSLLTEETLAERLAIAPSQPKEVTSTMRIPDQTELLSALSCPVQGFWGVDDKFCPVSGAMKLATRCAEAEVTLLSQCGHWVMVEHQALFNDRALDFLQRS